MRQEWGVPAGILQAIAQVQGTQKTPYEVVMDAEPPQPFRRLCKDGKCIIPVTMTRNFITLKIS
jgi:hypothetical protein